MGASTPFPTPAAIARAELFTRERFVYDGESLEDALAPGSARRRALDAALAELDNDAKTPSIEWRREFSLLLGLERVLSDDEPKLVDGTVLSAHQVDALSGTLTALLAEAQRSSANGNGNGKSAVDVLAAASILGVEEEEDAGLDDADMVAPEPDEEEDDDEGDDDDFAPPAAGGE